VLPSLAFEGFGLVTLEALACGTPALGTPIGATPEILRPLAMQLVLGGTETSAIGGGVRVMLEWLSYEAAADRLRAQCREYVVTKYRWDLAVDSLEGLFTEVASAGGEHE
jgi:glycosyltransferase involved in cell wall biosynthesis